jgi:pyrroline-5-carboxylate reductase
MLLTLCPDACSYLSSRVQPVDGLPATLGAGVTLETMENAVGPGIPIMRVMPNTPCLVGRCRLTA